MYTRKDAELFEKYPNASRDPKGRLIVGAAIGVKDIEAEVERAHKLAEAGADFIIIDIAHGDSENMLRMLDRLVKEGFDIPIIAGNIATEDAAKILIDHGAKGLKVGIGPGWACDTRVIAGVGRAQLSAVASVAAVANPQGIAIIADGGMREPADLVKALVCGADAGMFGGMFAGTDETPGKVIRRGDQRVKRYEGMASDAARARATSIAETLSSAGPYEERYLDQTQAAPEGREREVPVKGPVGIIFRRLDAGVRSGASYIGAHNIYEMREKGWFERVTGAGANEQYGRIG
jgi:IMP dehydrogenase